MESEIEDIVLSARSSKKMLFILKEDKRLRGNLYQNYKRK